MNNHELHGGVRHVGGKVEKVAGDVADRRDWQVGGVVDQVAGSAEHLFGRAQSIAADVVDATPALIGEAREAIGTAADRAAAATRDGARRADVAVRQHPGASAGVLAAAIGGLALGWLLFARRD
ncbi:uncharacterized protein YjbJ (UPF0337 family) [Sphingomonas sp. BE138]|uniref:CsbD family protein n=1 Tax=Sphingomonas sp. BE138 TaxID=2817845 RepID=UPI0028679669|nr:CsbD family protein [Sphingomonas sp. BE138]MDR6786722.1 uncharacterized protein YjbJ (UPF0337 family) [Sphingomonas sp. BE138]